MRLIGLALALAIGAGPASAQGIPRPVMPIGPLPAQDVAEIVQAMGLDPLGAPMRSGPFYLQRAVDDFGRVLRVTVDARRSQVVAVEAAGAVRSYQGYRPYRPYPGYAVLGPGDGLAPPGSILAPRAQPPHHAAVAPNPASPPQSVAPSRPAVKSATVMPARPPVPRKRPAVAPQDAVGSVEPVSASPAPREAAPQNAPPPAKTEGGSMPPVAPLE
jgi:hypothetical protein